MDENNQENNDQKHQNLKAEDVFAGEINFAPSTDDIFGGDEKLKRAIDHQNAGPANTEGGSVTYEVQAGSGISPKSLIATQVILGVLAVAVIALIFRPVPVPVVNIDSSSVNSNLTKTPEDIGEVQTAQNTPEKKTDESAAENTEEKTAEASRFVFNAPLSWKLGNELLKEGSYDKAYYVFEKLSQNLKLNDPDKDMFKDVLHLQMGLCKYYNGESDELSGLFTSVLQSRSPAVRTMGNYYLSFFEYKAKRFLSARKHAYRTLSTLEIVNEYFPKSLETDCYFLVGSAIMNELTSLNNMDQRLPGKNWIDTMTPYHLPDLDSAQLRSFLTKGISQLKSASLEPEVKINSDLAGEKNFSALSFNAPLQEIIAKYSTVSGEDIEWTPDTRKYIQRPVTMLVGKATRQIVPEYSIGSAGLIARFDGKSISVYNPNSYPSLSGHKNMLAQEGVSLWRRFLLRYRGDKRNSNAHFALAMIHEQQEMPHVAIGEYKIITSQYDRDDLAPYALLNSCRLKTKLSDFQGAKKDLRELIIRYPDAKIADKGHLMLAEATYELGQYEESFNLYMKAYYLKLTEGAKCDGAYGAGMCKYNLKDYEAAEEWFTRSVKSADKKANINLYKVYYMLGKVKHQLGKYEQAFEAYKLALPGNLNREEHCTIGIKVAQSLIKSGKLVEALNIMENVEMSALSAQQACEVLAVKANIFREMGIPENGISMLNRKVEFLADYEMRARLMIEISRSYRSAGNLKMAYEELVTAIPDLPAGELSLEANNELAEICIELKKYQQAEDICRSMLSMNLPEDVKHQTYSILGNAYQKQKKYKEAAEIFAGNYENKVIGKR